MLSNLITLSLLIVIYPLFLYLYFQYNSIFKDLDDFKKNTEEKFKKIENNVNTNYHILEKSNEN